MYVCNIHFETKYSDNNRKKLHWSGIDHKPRVLYFEIMS